MESTAHHAHGPQKVVPHVVGVVVVAAFLNHMSEHVKAGVTVFEGGRVFRRDVAVAQ